MLGGFRDFVQIPGGGRGQVYAAKASITALPAYTATALGGPLLFNPAVTAPSKGVTAYVLALSYGLSTASTAASSIGIATGSSTTPSSTTAIGLSGPLHPGGSSAQCSVFSTGTVSVAPTAYLVTGRVHTGAITVDTDDDNTVHLGGLIELAPGTFACPAAGAALTTSVIDIGIVWLEIAND